MPKLPPKPNVGDPILQKWINHIHLHVQAQSERQISPPFPPTNLKVIPGPGSNHVRFTGGANATGHTILASPNPNWDPTNTDNHVFDIGHGTEFPHVIGRPGVKWFYWIIATRDGLKSDPPVGPVSATTLALNTALTPSPVAKQQPGNVIRDSTTQRPTVILPGLTRGGRKP